DGGDELVGDGAAIESGWPVAGDGGERVGEVALQQGRARCERTAVGEEDLRRGGPACQARLRPRQRIRDVVLDRNALARERDGRRDQWGERELARAVFRVREREPRDRAGNADGERGVLGFARIGFTPLVEENLARGRRRRGLAIVDGGVGLAAG